MQLNIHLERKGPSLNGAARFGAQNSGRVTVSVYPYLKTWGIEISAKKAVSDWNPYPSEKLILRNAGFASIDLVLKKYKHFNLEDLGIGIELQFSPEDAKRCQESWS